MAPWPFYIVISKPRLSPCLGYSPCIPHSGGETDRRDSMTNPRILAMGLQQGHSSNPTCNGSSDSFTGLGDVLGLATLLTAGVRGVLEPYGLCGPHTVISLWLLLLLGVPFPWESSDVAASVVPIRAFLLRGEWGAALCEMGGGDSQCLECYFKKHKCD